MHLKYQFLLLWIWTADSSPTASLKKSLRVSAITTRIGSFLPPLESGRLNFLSPDIKSHEHQDVKKLQLDPACDEFFKDRCGNYEFVNVCLSNMLLSSNFEVARKLIRVYHADVDAVIGNPPTTTLDIAVDRNDENLVSKLMEFGLSPKNSLNRAVERHMDTAIIYQLLLHGGILSSSQVVDEQIQFMLNQMDAWWTVVEAFDIALAEAMLNDYPFLLNMRVTQYNALAYACIMKNVQFVQFMLDRGAAFDTANELGQTPIQLTANEEIINLLLDKACSVEQKKLMLTSALFHALESDNLILADFLTVIGADVDEKRSGTPALFSCDSAEALKLIIENDADLDAVDKFGRSYLMLSTQSDTTDLFDTLMDANVRIDIMDCHGRTALIYAMEDLLEGDTTVYYVTKLLERRKEITASIGAEEFPKYVKGLIDETTRALKLAEESGDQGLIDMLTQELELQQRLSRKRKHMYIN